MAALRDKAGRPIVVVTGMGVVTSNGAGQSENWQQLMAGRSGIRTITRFPTEGLKTHVAGTVDFVKAEPFSAPELAERMAELAIDDAIGQAAPVGAPQRAQKPPYPRPVGLERAVPSAPADLRQGTTQCRSR